MFLDLVLEFFRSYLGLFLLWGVGSWLAYNRYAYGLNHIPGPKLASLTNFWRLFVVYGRRAELEYIRLHEKYGSLVRLGPNLVSVSDASAIPVIYALNAGFIKSDFYKVQQTLAKGQPLLTLFTSTDEGYHSKLRRAVSNAYAMSTLVQSEPYIDSTTTEFIRQIQSRFADKPGKICDLGFWLQLFAFDVIGELTYSKRLGFIENGIDVEGIISSIEGMLDYAAVVGQMPGLDKLLIKNPIRKFCSKLGLLNSNTYMVSFARKRLDERVDPLTGLEKLEAKLVTDPPRRDFLSRFLEAHKKDPDMITNQRVLALTVANVFAGSDTTAISLRAVFYYLLKNPADMQSLLNEIFEQKRNGKFARADGLVDWKVVRELPFLDAVVKEALRCHPATGLPLERITPKAGITVCGKFIPGGTIIGCNAWTVHNDASVFGEAPKEFRPRRWIDASQDQRRLMENSILTFGAGSRTCIGKNISLLEMYKLIPAFLMKFQIELANPDAEWKLHNAWFVKQSNLHVRIKTRSDWPSPMLSRQDAHI